MDPLLSGSVPTITPSTLTNLSSLGQEAGQVNRAALSIVQRNLEKVATPRMISYNRMNQAAAKLKELNTFCTESQHYIDSGEGYGLFSQIKWHICKAIMKPETFEKYMQRSIEIEKQEKIAEAGGELGVRGDSFTLEKLEEEIKAFKGLKETSEWKALATFVNTGNQFLHVLSRMMRASGYPPRETRARELFTFLEKNPEFLAFLEMINDQQGNKVPSLRDALKDCNDRIKPQKSPPAVLGDVGEDFLKSNDQIKPQESPPESPPAVLSDLGKDLLKNTDQIKPQKSPPAVLGDVGEDFLKSNDQIKPQESPPESPPAVLSDLGKDLLKNTDQIKPQKSPPAVLGDVGEDFLKSNDQIKPQESPPESPPAVLSDLGKDLLKNTDQIKPQKSPPAVLGDVGEDLLRIFERNAGDQGVFRQRMYDSQISDIAGIWTRGDTESLQHLPVIKNAYQYLKDLKIDTPERIKKHKELMQKAVADCIDPIIQARNLQYNNNEEEIRIWCPMIGVMVPPPEDIMK